MKKKEKIYVASMFIYFVEACTTLLFLFKQGIGFADDYMHNC